MNKIKWIKDLVLADQKSSQKSRKLLDVPERRLEEETLSFLKDLKLAFIEVASVFNQMKGSTIGNLKIYGISKTEADFMLFRNNLKLSFMMKQPGVILISFSRIGSFSSGESKSVRSAVELEEPSESLRAQPGAFGEFHWFCKGYAIRIDYLVRYYLSRFVKQSV